MYADQLYGKPSKPRDRFDYQKGMEMRSLLGQ